MPLKRFGWNVSPIPLMAPPPLGRLMTLCATLDLLLTLELRYIQKSFGLGEPTKKKRRKDRPMRTVIVCADFLVNGPAVTSGSFANHRRCPSGKDTFPAVSPRPTGEALVLHSCSLGSGMVVAASPAPISRLHFGVFTVDTGAGELNKYGIRVKLQERPFQLLVALVERPGEVVTREELRQRLWPDGTFVDFDHSISSAINRLRSALSDSATQPRYIETVGRRGYRFLYPVSKTVPDGSAISATASTRTSPRYRRVAVLVGLALVVLGAGIALALRTSSGSGSSGPIRALVVLPLKNLSSDPEQEYFSEGLTDELVTHLASLEGLRVISRASAMQYKDSRKPLRTIAKELNVDAIVEGSVLRSDGRVRITARLVEAASDRHIWAKSYERDHRDILDLQNEVTRDIAQNIKLSLTPAARQRLAASRPIDPEAHEDYLRGRFYWAKRRPAELKTATSYFEKAIARDPRVRQRLRWSGRCLQRDARVQSRSSG